jgi:hypothetical protein
VFNQFGDLERCALRAGNVHSADGWESVLRPVVARYRGKVSRIYFRADAGFANPKVYEYLESERQGDHQDRHGQPRLQHEEARLAKPGRLRLRRQSRAPTPIAPANEDLKRRRPADQASKPHGAARTSTPKPN